MVTDLVHDPYGHCLGSSPGHCWVLLLDVCRVGHHEVEIEDDYVENDLCHVRDQQGQAQHVNILDLDLNEVENLVHLHEHVVADTHSQKSHHEAEEDAHLSNSSGLEECLPCASWGSKGLRGGPFP